MNLVPPWSGCKGYRVKSLAAAVLLVLAAAASHPALMAQTPAPVISKLKPDSGPVGTNVKIKGSNFGTSPGTVTFNGTNAPLNPSSNWESKKIQARVPEGATTGLVVVTTAGGQSSNSVIFEVTSAPTGPNISKLEPDSAPVGTEIKIKGSNFGTSGSVTFNGTAASTNGWNDKKIQAVVPSTATDGPVVVTVDGESSNGVTFDVTAGVPTISKLEPDSGPVLTQVNIKGSNFGGQEGTVTFNGVTHDPSRWNHNIIHAQVPQGATTGPVVVTTSAGRSSAGVTFTVTPSASRPIISRLDPNSGLVDASVTIEGSNFGSSSGTVTFNGTTASTTSWASDEIQTKVPSGATTGPVVVRTSGGQSSAGVSFTVTLPAPVISRLDPNSGLVNSSVTIEGSNFGSQTGSVTFNGTTASTTSWDSDEIQTKVPSGATTGPVVVRTSGGKASAGVTFTVTLPAPVISRLDPNSGLVNSSVTIEGSNFGSQTGSITFNGTTASTTSWASDEIQTKVPSGATTGPVVVRTSGGKASAGVSFTVTLPAPVISRLDPDSGLVDASVTIEGSNFGTTTGIVTFNGTTASTTSWASDEIQTKVPSGATTGPVVVRTSGGKASAGVTFTVTLPAPVISRLDPEFGTGGRQRHHRGIEFRDILGNRHLQRNHRFDHQLGQRRDSDKGAVRGHHGGGGSKDVRWKVERRSLLHRDPPCAGHLPAGSQFGTGGRQRHHRGVQFRDHLGNRHLQRNHRIDDQLGRDEIQTSVPQGATTGPVVVRTSGGQSSAGVAFTVTLPAPVISRLDPDSGLVDANVTIEGSNFGTSSGTVTFNGTTASTTSWDADEIQTSVPDGATSGPVVVRTSGGQSSAGVSFTVTIPAPVISRLDPDSGLVDASSPSRAPISGHPREPSPSTEPPPPPPVGTATRFRQGAVGATTGPVVVTTSAGQSSAGVTFTVTVPAPASPGWTRFGTGGRQRHHRGVQFRDHDGNRHLQRNHRIDTSWDSEEIQASVPQGATTGPVVVRTSGGQSSAGVTFTVTLPAPVISRLDPSSGLVDASVTIEGSNFGTILGNRHLQRNHRLDHQLGQPTRFRQACRRSHHRAGGGEDVRWAVERRGLLHRDHSCAGHLPAGSRFGTGGRQRHHRGFQFRDHLGNRHLQRNHRLHHQLGQRRDSDKGAVRGHHGAGGGEDVRWAVERWSLLHRDHPCAGHLPAGSRFRPRGRRGQDPRLQFRRPDGHGHLQWPDRLANPMERPDHSGPSAGGSHHGPVVVTTAGGQSSAGVTFTVTDPPSGPIISKLEPDSGLVGANVKITGSNFGTSSGTVTFNGTTASTTSWNSDEIQTSVPEGATTGLVVVTVDGEPSAGVTFTVTIPAPVISRLDPNSGLVDANVTIEGSNFGSQTGTVTFNGTTASTTSWDTDEIQTSVPSGATTGPVVVTTAGGKSSAGVTFTVTIPAPVISRLDPDSGLVDASVTIEGSNFGTTSGTVTFNGTTASTPVGTPTRFRQVCRREPPRGRWW